uniref:Uncharacterized protein n=1 Tax=Kalanchoe fedtschenkoi TaxID=63787 RepID=A0A7N0TJY0_KALFE
MNADVSVDRNLCVAILRWSINYGRVIQDVILSDQDLGMQVFRTQVAFLISFRAVWTSSLR